jgi:hypothetical protein
MYGLCLSFKTNANYSMIKKQRDKKPDAGRQKWPAKKNVFMYRKAG